MDGSQVRRVAQIVDTVFGPDLVRFVFQASLPVLSGPSNGFTSETLQNDPPSLSNELLHVGLCLDGVVLMIRNPLKEKRAVFYSL